VEIRNTIQRHLVLEAARAMDHPSAEDIYQAIAKTYPGISRGTVYRNLHVLVKTGRLAQIHVPNGPDRFDKTLGRHYHGVCRRCGAVLDTALPLGAEIPDSLVLDSGFLADGHNLVFWGTCGACRDSHEAEDERVPYRIGQFAVQETAEFPPCQFKGEKK
jgi:Fur family peroxide stress response transcriptional regulator